MSDEARHQEHEAAHERHAEEAVDAELSIVQQFITQFEIPSIKPVTFRPGALVQRDEQGPNAASIGIYNPVKARVYLGLFGGGPTPNGFPVPAESVLVAPINVPGNLDIAIDEAELGEGNEATVYVLRFKTPQPFYLGSA